MWPEWDRVAWPAALFCRCLGRRSFTNFNKPTLPSDSRQPKRRKIVSPSNHLFNKSRYSERRGPVLGIRNCRTQWSKPVQPDAWSDPLGAKVASPNHSSDPEAHIADVQLRQRLLAALTTNGYDAIQIRMADGDSQQDIRWRDIGRGSKGIDGSSGSARLGPDAIHQSHPSDDEGASPPLERRMTLFPKAPEFYERHVAPLRKSGSPDGPLLHLAVTFGLQPFHAGTEFI